MQPPPKRTFAGVQGQKPDAPFKLLRRWPVENMACGHQLHFSRKTFEGEADYTETAEIHAGL